MDLPLDVFVRHIAPYAFDSIKDALNVTLVCRRVHERAMTDFSFWRPFLRLANRDAPGKWWNICVDMYGTDWHVESARALFGWTAWQLICSMWRKAPKNYRSKEEGNGFFYAWEEGHRIEARWVDGEVVQVVGWTHCGAFVMPYEDGAWNGAGRILWKCGLLFHGTMKSWRCHGRGSFKCVDGTVIEGDWEDGDCAAVSIIRKDEQVRVGHAKRIMPYAIGVFEPFFIVFVGQEQFMVTQGRGVLEPFRDDAWR